MTGTSFDNLTVLCRTQTCRAGWTELCRDGSGARLLRLRIRRPAIQKAVLARLPRSAPARLSDGGLEVLLPWREGQTLEEWLYAARPNLALRREMCLSLLAGLIGRPEVPDLVVLSARGENLRFSSRESALQLVPRLTDWQPGLELGDAVQAAALLAREILTHGLSPGERRRAPEELRLILLRCGGGDYRRWETLQRDLAALPDRFPPAGLALRRAAGRLRRTAGRYGGAILRAAAVLLAAAALLSLAGALRTWRYQQNSAWPGITAVGGQVLHSGEGGTE